MKKSFPYLSRLVLLFASAAILVAQADHAGAFTGNWKMDVAKSKYSPGSPPQSQTVTIAPDGAFTLEGVDAQGKPVKWSHPWAGNGEVAIRGVGNGTVLWKVRGHTIDETLMTKNTSHTRQLVVSPDGRTMTVTHTHNVGVYEKQ